MNRKMTRSLTLLLLLAMVVPPVAAVAAEEATRVDAVSATKSGSVVNVTGTALFASVPALVGTDAVGDARVAGIGTDFSQATISRPDPFGEILRFTISVADQPEDLTGVPEAVCYLWKFEVGGATFVVRGFRAHQAWSPGSIDPVFRLHEGAPGLVAELEEPVTLSGRMQDGVVEFDVPMSEIRASEGTEIKPAEGTGLYRFFIGAALTPGGACQPGESLNDKLDRVETGSAAIVPRATVRLGIAPAGTPSSAIPLTTDADVASDGGFLGALSLAGRPPGTYLIRAQACYGPGNCGDATTSIKV